MRSRGFTLLEVMLAVFVFATAMGGLLQLLGTHLSTLGDARRELVGGQLAAEKLRELQVSAEGGAPPEPGESEGVFDEPDDDLHWLLRVEPISLPMPPELAGEPPPSSLFSQPTIAPTTGQTLQPSLLRVSLRVFPEGAEDPEGVDPYVLYVVRPPSEEEIALLRDQLEQAEP